MLIKKNGTLPLKMQSIIANKITAITYRIIKQDIESNFQVIRSRLVSTNWTYVYEW